MNIATNAQADELQAHLDALHAQRDALNARQSPPYDAAKISVAIASVNAQILALIASRPAISSTVAQLPSPQLTLVGRQAHASDALGGGCPVWNDGQDWRKVKDNSFIWTAPDLTARRQLLGVPNYSYPPGAWATYNAQGFPGVYLQILNPNSGPGAAPDANYQAVAAEARAGGGLVLGYVHCSYGDRPLADVFADIDAFFAFYGAFGLGGIFLDETPDGKLGYISRVRAYLLGKPYTQQFLALNPGTPVEEDYMTVADAIVTFEDIAANYIAHVPARWEANYERHRIWHLIHTTANQPLALQLRNLAHERNVGTIYITEQPLPNPWGVVSAYGAAIEAALAATGGADKVIDIPGRVGEWWLPNSTLGLVGSGVILAALNNDVGANGYVVGQVFPVVGGTSSVVANITVLAIDVLGGPTRISWTPGTYTVAPPLAQNFGSGFKVNLTMGNRRIVSANPDAAAVPNAIASAGAAQPFTDPATPLGPLPPGSIVRFTGSQYLRNVAWVPAPTPAGALLVLWAVFKTSTPDKVILGGVSNQFGLYTAGAGCTVSYQAGAFQGGTIDVVGAWCIAVVVLDATGVDCQLRVNGKVSTRSNPGAGIPTQICLGDYADLGNGATMDSVGAGATRMNRENLARDLARLEAVLSARTGIVLG